MDESLRILIQNRPDSRTNPGGDTVQMDQTARYLCKCGHCVEISFELEPTLEAFDMVHLFNLTRPLETWMQARNAERQGKPYVLSPIYWDLEAAVPWHAYEFPRNVWRLLAPHGLRETLRPSEERRRWRQYLSAEVVGVNTSGAGLRARQDRGKRTSHQLLQDGGQGRPPHQGAQSENSFDELPGLVLRGARLVFPNSEAEKAHLLERFYGDKPEWNRNRASAAKKMVVVYNGIDAGRFAAAHRPEASAPSGVGSPVGWAPPTNTENNSAAPREQAKLRAAPREQADSADGSSPDASRFHKCFLCAGAIGPRKNQLNLVKAFRRLPNERLIIVGQAAPGCGRYYQAAVRAAPANVAFRDRVAHEEMDEMLRNAKALVQPSFIETPGLSAMEAAAMGVPIVVADVAPVREYLGELGHYCDPASVESIASACRSAADAPRRDGRAFAEKYDWDRVLEPLGEAYGELETECRV